MSKNRKSFQKSRKNCKKNPFIFSKKSFFGQKSHKKVIKRSKNRKSFQKSRKSGQKSLLFCQKSQKMVKK